MQALHVRGVGEIFRVLRPIQLGCSPKKREWFCYGKESSMLGICVYRASEAIPDGPAGV